MPAIIAKSSRYTTPYGRKIIGLNVMPEYEQTIVQAAQSKQLTRQAYIILAINAALEKDGFIKRGNANDKTEI